MPAIASALAAARPMSTRGVRGPMVARTAAVIRLPAIVPIRSDPTSTRGLAGRFHRGGSGV